MIESQLEPRISKGLNFSRTPRDRSDATSLSAPDGAGRLLEEEERRRKLYRSVVGKATISIVFFSNFIVYTSLSMLSPFFPMYAENTLHVSSLTVGIIFSAHPIAEIIFCPAASLFCKTVGRLLVFQTGLFMLSGGIMLFGMSRSVTLFILARLLQGTGSTCIQVSGLALIMQHSSKLTRDLGIQEMMAGLGYSIGPAIGGALYATAGIEVMYMCVSFVPMLVLLLIHMARYFLPGSTKDEIGPVDDHFEMRNLLSLPVIASSIAITVTAASFGFLDTTLADHLRHIAGLGPSQAGFIYVLPPLSYAIFSIAAGRFSAAIGNKNAIMLGLLLSSLAFVMIGPLPLIHFHLDTFTTWATLIICLVLMGVGETLILIPAVPLMLNTISRSKLLGAAGRKRHARNAHNHDYNDVVAGIFSFFWSFGDFIGPLLGGVLTEYAPKITENPCHDTPAKCLSSFPWASFIFGCLGLSALLLVCVVVPGSGLPGKRGTSQGHADEITSSDSDGEAELTPLTAAAAVVGAAGAGLGGRWPVVV